MEWNDGMNSGTTAPIERSIPASAGVARSRLGDQSVVLKCAGKFPSVKLEEAIGLIHR